MGYNFIPKRYWSNLRIGSSCVSIYVLFVFALNFGFAFLLVVN